MKPTGGIDPDSLKHVPVMRLPPGYKNWDEWFEEQAEKNLLEGLEEGLRRLREKERGVIAWPAPR